MKKHPSKKRIQNPTFETLAILDRTHTEPGTNVSVPSEQAVVDAKAWVDYNKK